MGFSVPSRTQGQAGAAGATGATGTGVTHTVVNASGHLIVTYSDGSTVDAGYVQGATGAAGATGRGIASTAIQNGLLVLTYTDGSTATLGNVVGPQGATGATGATGAAGLGVSSTAITNGHLVLTYSDGTTADVGQVVGAAGATGATGAAGRGITSTAITAGALVVTYTDGTTANLGNVTGPQGAGGVTPWAAVAAWAANTAYTSNAPASVVTYDDGTGLQTYVAKAGVGNFTSGSTFNAANWTLIAAHGAAGAAGSANLTTFRRVYISSVEITASNSSYNFTGAVPAGATEVEIECVGGGASGNSGTSSSALAGHGGQPGAVSRICKRVVDVPSTLSVTIGAGGAATAVTSYSQGNPGGTTSFGTLLQARGGQAGNYSSYAALTPSQAEQPSSPQTGRPGYASAITQNANNALPYSYLAALPSMGPGAGGAGLPSGLTGSDYSGAGGDSGIHLPNSTKTGGVCWAANLGATHNYNGTNATDVFGYGSGGAGGVTAGGNGGLPGGGGGGGAAISTGTGGAGGRGAVRLHFYHYEAP